MGNEPHQSSQSSYGVQPSISRPAAGQKKSRRKLWTTLAIIGGIIILSCLVCTVATAMRIGPLAQAAGPVVVADQYYQAIQGQDYTKAYSFLSHDAVLSVQNQTVSITSVETFSSAAQTLDRQFGTATSHTIRATSLDTSHLVAIVSRNGKQYEVTLNLVQVGQDWKIKTMDGI